jgi:hypothetical protein
MSGRVSAYGFLGKWPGSVRHRMYRMPSSVSAPFRSWQLLSLSAWPSGEGFGFQVSGSGSNPRAPSPEPLLLSVKVEKEYGHWQELLPEPRALAEFTPRDVGIDLAIGGAVPERLRKEPGDYFTFVGECPHGWERLNDSRGLLSSAPRGPIAVRWDGALRGLLLVGMDYG